VGVKNWELVEHWFGGHESGHAIALHAFREGDRTGEVLKQLKTFNFPYNRDALEMWRRHQGFQKPAVTAPMLEQDTAGNIVRNITRDMLYDTIHLPRVEPAHHFVPLPDDPPWDISVPRHTHSIPEPWKDGVRLYVILPDQQIPHHDPHLNELVLRFLDTNKARITGKIYSGDLIDLPGCSRHPWDPNMDPDPLRSTRDAIKATNVYLDDCEQACPSKGEDALIEGNHELRLRAFVLRQAPQLHFLEEEDGESTLDIYRLLRLKKRRIRVPERVYPQDKHWLSDRIAVIHGRLARAGSGVTALATLRKLGHSVIMGHTHRQSMVFETQHPRKGAETRVAVEAGTLARIEDGLGYCADPDWQQGLVVVRLYPDGGFHTSLGTYVRGVFRWEDQELRSSGHGVSVSV
jgi:hypothetical protein